MKKTTPKKTTKPIPTSEATLKLDPDLPIIKIVSEEEEMHVKMELEMENKTHDMLVKVGKKVATDQDYVEIAVRAGLKEYVDSIEE